MKYNISRYSFSEFHSTEQHGSFLYSGSNFGQNISPFTDILTNQYSVIIGYILRYILYIFIVILIFLVRHCQRYLCKFSEKSQKVMGRLSDEARQESWRTVMFAEDIVVCNENREQVKENLRGGDLLLKEEEQYRVNVCD